MKAERNKKRLRIALIPMVMVMVFVLMVAGSKPDAEGQRNISVSYAMGLPQNEETGISYERVIAHAGGTIDGNRSTNSLDALNQSVSLGYKLVELDFGFSSDGQLVMLHDWTSIGPEIFGTKEGYVMSFSEYKDAKILGKYQTLTMERLIQVLDENPGVRIITDVKEENVRALTAIAKQYPDHINRFIPQIYTLEEYDAVAALGYEDIILTLYRLWQINLSQVKEFALEKNLYAVTMSIDYKNRGWAEELQSYGIPVYTHTVNSFEEAEALIDLGFIGVYTDELPPQFWQGNYRDYYLVNTSGTAVGERLHHQSNEGSITLKMKGPSNDNGTVKYYIDGELIATARVNEGLRLDLGEREYGKLSMVAEVTNERGVKLLEQTYYLWNDRSMSQVMLESCEYMLDGWVPMPDFDEEMAEVNPKVREILENSFIAKAGSHIYYNDGRSDIFYNDRKLFPAYLDSEGSVLVAFSASCLKLGAESAYMDDSRMMYVKYGGKVYTSQVGSYLVSWDGGGRTMKKSISLFQGRAVSSGGVLAAIFDRTIMDQNGYLIILPRGTVLTDLQKKQLMAAAQPLFPQAEAEPEGESESEA